MNLRFLLRLGRQQACVLLTGVLAALVVGATLASLTPREFSGEQVVVVAAPSLLPAEPDRPFEGTQVTNPLTRNDGSLAEVARLLAANSSVDEIRTDPQVQVTVGTELTFIQPTSPFLLVTAKGQTPESVVGGVESEVALLRGELRRYQLSLAISPQASLTLQSVSNVAVERVGLLASARSALVAAVTVLAGFVLFAFARADGSTLTDVPRADATRSSSS